MRIAVCGGRFYANKAKVFEVLDDLHARHFIDCVVHGGCLVKGIPSGADMLAEEWAREREVVCVRVPARWNQYGGRAGPIRNDAMLKEWTPFMLVAFPGGRGTSDCVFRAKCLGIQVREVG